MGFQQREPSDALPIRIVVRDCAMKLDGGTIGLIATDEAGRLVSITLPSPFASSPIVAGRLYFDGGLVPMRSEREAQILKLLSEATVQTTQRAPADRSSRMAIIGEDIKQFLAQTPEQNCRTFIHKIKECVQSDNYVKLATDEEKALVDEANRDDWEQPSGKKKRRAWRHGH
jgi:hypothetical protein